MVDIFQVASNVSLVAETGCGKERKHVETQIARVERIILCCDSQGKPFAEKQR